jgi:hypothetical protein
MTSPNWRHANVIRTMGGLLSVLANVDLLLTRSFEPECPAITSSRLDLSFVRRDGRAAEIRGVMRHYIALEMLTAVCELGGDRSTKESD